MKKRLWTGLVLFCMVVSAAVGKSEDYRYGAYMYGLAVSLMDSVVYVTEVQKVEQAAVNAKTGFLEARPMYSEQLRSYLERQGASHSITCAVSFHEKAHKLNKKYQRVMAKYAKKKGVTLKALKAADFKFEAVKPINEAETTAEEN